MVYTLFRSHRHSISIQIHPDKGVIVRAPTIMPKFIIERFIRQKTNWINKHLEKAKNATQKTPTKAFIEGETHLFLGEQKDLGVYSKNEIAKFYKTKALPFLAERVNHYAKILNAKKRTFKITPRSIKIRKYHSRWGTCTANNDLIFNWQIMMAPLPLIDYLVIHELCHIVHKNHSHRFYDLVATLDPDYKAHRKTLRENSQLYKL